MYENGIGGDAEARDFGPSAWYCCLKKFGYNCGLLIPEAGQPVGG